VEKYRGRFDAGWDRIREQWFERQKELGIVPEGTELAPRNPGVEPWEELSEKQKRFALRLQEAFAGFLDHTDAQIGRLLSFLEELGEMDDTLIILLSDNGASQEGGPGGVMDEFKYFNAIPEDVDHVVERLDDIGGPHSHTNYPWGWAQAGNTPLKWYKTTTFSGGVRDPLVVAWQRRIKDPGGVRHQFHHVTDIVPTVLEELGIEPPATVRGYEQMPIHGTSMSYALDDADAPTRKGVQYFEMFGHRGIWLDGWKAVTYHRRGTPFEDDQWELYHVDEDFSEARDLAIERPEKLRELIDRWWVEAGEHGVLPLDERRGAELFGGTPRPGTPHARREYVYYPPISHMPSDTSPRLGARSWEITTEIERSSADDEGVLVAQGTHNVGFSFYVKDNRLVFDYNYFTQHTRVESETELPTGRRRAGVRFVRRDQSGEMTLLIDGAAAGSGQVPRILRMVSSTGLDVGRDSLSPVTDDYEAPFEFTGTIHRVNFELLRREDVEREAAEAEARTEMARE
jgi:arylsulfatase